MSLPVLKCSIMLTKLSVLFLPMPADDKLPVTAFD